MAPLKGDIDMGIDIGNMDIDSDMAISVNGGVLPCEGVMGLLSRGFTVDVRQFRIVLIVRAKWLLLEIGGSCCRCPF